MEPAPDIDQEPE